MRVSLRDSMDSWEVELQILFYLEELGELDYFSEVAKLGVDCYQVLKECGAKVFIYGTVFEEDNPSALRVVSPILFKELVETYIEIVE